jgi:hypothetical protein
MHLKARPENHLEGVDFLDESRSIRPRSPKPVPSVATTLFGLVACPVGPAGVDSVACLLRDRGGRVRPWSGEAEAHQNYRPAALRRLGPHRFEDPGSPARIRGSPLGGPRSGQAEPGQRRGRHPGIEADHRNGDDNDADSDDDGQSYDLEGTPGQSSGAARTWFIQVKRTPSSVLPSDPSSEIAIGRVRPASRRAQLV